MNPFELGDPRRLGRRTTQRLSEAATVGGYRAGALAARLVPGIATPVLAPTFGLGAQLASPERRDMIRRHLRRVVPRASSLQIRRMSLEAFDSYAQYWLETFRLPNLSARTVDRGFAADGYSDHIVPALAEGRGVILALPHLGGWEWAGRWLTDRGHPVTAVVEQIEPPELFDWFAGLRADLGMTVVPLDGQAGKAVLGALKRNEIVCLLCDRDIQRNGIEVEFFGERTTLPAGPATIALRSGAPILPTAVYFTGRADGHHAWVRPPLDTSRGSGSLRDDITRVTQDLAYELEVLIRRAPQQWHLFQPNWPSDPGY
ncbi:MAG: phosphatidylinositol mannoside acyltransferase [Ilumatobacteraceae bacterium]|nr:phosphatidylinositol mannoside acyltransferase [Ilumatobacteraceae bacterium]